MPKTDADGNDLAGVRLPEVQVPLATYTGWALRAAPQDNDGCEGSGQYIPFASTKADRLAVGDPRLSIEERYPDLETYSSRLRQAINNLEQASFLLPSDVQSMLKKNLTNAARKAWLQNPRALPPATIDGEGLSSYRPTHLSTREAYKFARYTVLSSGHASA